MDAGTAKELLERLECRRIRVTGGQIVATCPFNENHYRGDRRPSFGARLNDTGDKSPYFCFGCHERGTLEWIAYNTGNEDLIPEWKPTKVRTKRWMRKPSNNRGIFPELYEKKPVFFNEHYIEPFMGRLSGKLIKRGITIETAKEWELGVDQYEKRAIFVLRDIEGRVAMVNGRDVSGKSKIKYITYVLDQRYKKLVPRIDYEREEDFKRPVKSLFLYGEYHAQKVLNGEFERRSSDLVVVEGQMDVLKVWQYGWNVVGISGSYPSKEQCEKLLHLLPKDGRIVAMMDADKSGRQSAIELYGFFKDRLPVFNAELREGMDPGDATEEELVECIAKARMFNLTMVK